MINFNKCDNPTDDKDILETYSAELQKEFGGLFIILTRFRNGLGNKDSWVAIIKNEIGTIYIRKYFECSNTVLAMQRVPYILEVAMDEEEKKLHYRHETFKKLINQANEELVDVLEE